MSSSEAGRPGFLHVSRRTHDCLGRLQGQPATRVDWQSRRRPTRRDDRRGLPQTSTPQIVRNGSRHPNSKTTRPSSRRWRSQELRTRSSKPPYVVTVTAFDWNCPQHIPQRFTLAQVEQRIAPLRDRIRGTRGSAFRQYDITRNGRPDSGSDRLTRPSSASGTAVLGTCDPASGSAWPHELTRNRGAGTTGRAMICT